MKLLGSKKKEITINEDDELVPRLEMVNVILMHYNLVNNNYQQASNVLITFVQEKQFGQLITVEPKSLKTINVKNNKCRIFFYRNLVY